MAISNLFNAEWYLSQNPDVRDAVEAGLVDAETHFQLHGRVEGRSPSPTFDPAYYLAKNPDVKDAVDAGLVTAYDHFLLHGLSEARPFVPFFDVNYYLDKNSDVRGVVGDDLEMAITHFLLHGQGETRAISPFFDLAAYLEANPDVKKAVDEDGASPLAHLLHHGFAEGRPLGNGITLEQFANDPAFNDAANPLEALARVAEVAPFLPSFQPPAGWAAPENTPIPTGFVPVEGEKLVVPPTVKVPDGTKLPDAFEPSAPAPTPPGGDTGDGSGGNDSGPTFTVKKTPDGVITFEGSSTKSVTVKQTDDGVITFESGYSSRDIVLAEGEKLSDLSFKNAADVQRIVADAGQVILKSLPGTDGSDPMKIALHETIATAIGAADEHDEINVGAGTYNEKVVLDKAGLKLLGPNAGLSPTGERLDEAKITWNGEGYSYVVTSTTEAVGSVISGFTIEGTTGAKHTQTGALVLSNDTKVADNIIDNFNYMGVWVNYLTRDEDSDPWTINLVENVEVSNNKISNINQSLDNKSSVGHAIYVQGALADIKGNTIEDSYTGIQIQPYGVNYNGNLYDEVTHESPSVTGNTIEAAYRGIWLNYGQSGAPKWIVEGNDIEAVAPHSNDVPPTNWQGIWIQNFMGGDGFSIRDNAVDGSKVAVEAFGIRLSSISKGDPSKLEFAGNSFSNVRTVHNEAPGSVVDLAGISPEEVWSDFSTAKAPSLFKYGNADVTSTFGVKGNELTDGSVHIYTSAAAPEAMEFEFEGNGASSFTGVYWDNVVVENVSVATNLGNSGYTSFTGTTHIEATGAGDFGLLTFGDGSLQKLDASAVEGSVTLRKSIDISAAKVADGAEISTGSGDDYIDVSESSGQVNIVAGSGDDTIIVAAGEHMLTGGKGQDTFVLKANDNAEFGVISDFNVGGDIDTLRFNGSEMTSENTHFLADSADSLGDIRDAAVEALEDGNSFVAFVWDGGTYIFHSNDGADILEVQLAGIVGGTEQLFGLSV